MSAVCFLVANYMFQGTPDKTQLLIAMGSRPMMAVALLFIALSFTLQSMRLRDIGWDPVCIIPCWIALLMIDHLVASKIPAWSVGHDHESTVVGALINLVLWLALTFWPGGSAADAPEPAIITAHQAFDNLARRATTRSATAARIARVTERPIARWT
jgi:hypothetical protein